MAGFSFDRINPRTSKINYAEEGSILPMRFSKSAAKKVGKNYIVNLTDFLEKAGLRGEAKTFSVTEGGTEVADFSSDMLKKVYAYGGISKDEFIGGSDDFNKVGGGLALREGTLTQNLLRKNGGIKLPKGIEVPSADIVFNLEHSQSFVAAGFAHEAGHAFDFSMANQARHKYTEGSGSLTGDIIKRVDAAEKAHGGKRLSLGRIIDEFTTDLLNDVPSWRSPGEGLNIGYVSPEQEADVSFNRLSKHAGYSSQYGGLDSLMKAVKANPDMTFDEMAKHTFDSGFYSATVDLGVATGKSEAFADTAGMAAARRVSEADMELSKKIGIMPGINQQIKSSGEMVTRHVLDKTPGAKISAASLAMGFFSAPMRKGLTPETKRKLANTNLASAYATGEFRGAVSFNYLVNPRSDDHLAKLPEGSLQKLRVKSVLAAMEEKANAAAAGTYAAKVGGFTADGSDSVSGLGKIYSEIVGEQFTDEDAMRTLSYQSGLSHLGVGKHGRNSERVREVVDEVDLILEKKLVGPYRLKPELISSIKKHGLASFGELHPSTTLDEVIETGIMIPKNARKLTAEETEELLNIRGQFEVGEGSPLRKLYDETFLNAEKKGRYGIDVKESNATQSVQGRIASSSEMLLDAAVDPNGMASATSRGAARRTAGTGSSKSMLAASADTAKAVSRKDSTGMRLAGAAATIFRRRLL